MGKHIILEGCLGKRHTVSIYEKLKWGVLITNQLNFKQSDIYEDSELLNSSQSFQESDDPGVYMMGQRPR